MHFSSNNFNAKKEKKIELACYLKRNADIFLPNMYLKSNIFFRIQSIKKFQPQLYSLMASAWLLSKVLYLRPFFQDLTRILITVFALVSIRIWMDENTFPAFGYILLHIPRKNWVTYTCYPKANIGSDGRKSKMHVGVLTTSWILMADF